MTSSDSPDHRTEKRGARIHQKLIFWVGVATSLFHIWVNTLGLMPEIQRNAVHFALIMFMAFLVYPGFAKNQKEPGPVSYAFAILSLLLGAYLIFFEDALHARNEVPILSDLLASGLAVYLLLEVTRRAAGWTIPIVSLICICYALFLGAYFPGMWNFPGVTVTRLLYRMFWTPDGILGSIASISSTFVFLFVLFGSFLIKSGAGDFIIRLSMAAMGRLVGGPAKMAVFASGMMGSVSGSAVANTVTTGSITIPMMMRTGFSPKFSAAVEAAASTGGQLMPPIMGAGAFIMSQWTQIPYLTIVSVAFIPAIMYFLSVGFFIHLRAKKLGLKPMPADQVPSLLEVLKDGWNFIAPIGLLILLLVKGFTPTYAACLSIVAIPLCSLLNRRHRMSINDVLDALAQGARNMVTTGVILLCAGIVVGLLVMAAIGIKFSMVIPDLAGGSLLLTIVVVAIASLFLGMGLPVTASYIVLAVLAAPALTALGVSTLAAHMLIFWYSQDSGVTPPVCLSAYTAAGISGSKPLPTGMAAWKIAKGLYFIPLLFCYTPILFQGPAWQAVETAIAGLLGLYAYAAAFEGYHLGRLTWPARLAMAGATALLLWPSLIAHGIGLLLLIGVSAISSFSVREASHK
jgi:TRAP transporter 4TM/12TM fusion protein